jgi:hypothetical protein
MGFVHFLCCKVFNWHATIKDTVHLFECGKNEISMCIVCNYYAVVKISDQMEKWNNAKSQSKLQELTIYMEQGTRSADSCPAGQKILQKDYYPLHRRQKQLDQNRSWFNSVYTLQLYTES